MTTYRLTQPSLGWDDNGIPVSNQFDDVYFDREAGLAETRFVFLQHNNLQERFSQLNAADQNQTQAFTIAETGFGTGLNFLCAWQLWQQINQAEADKKALVSQQKRLHFISVEKYPLSKAELTKALAMWPSLKPLADELLDNYPILCQGLHRLHLDNHQVQLTLWFGDASKGFSAINADVDAWFLDGFAPSKNPDMWNEVLFENIKRLSHIGTTFATFTAAGIVRRGLQAVDFTVNKVKGFGKKREMLTGVLSTQPQTFQQRATSGQAWFNNRLEQQTPPANTHVLVVGAGLAGCHTARALAHKGIQVTVWEQHNQVAQEASGNPQGILYPKLASTDSPINRFYLSSYLYANTLLNQTQSQTDNHFWQQSGLEQRATSPIEQDRFTKLLTQTMYPEDVLTAYQKPAYQHASLWLPLSGWVRPSIWCQELMQHKNINFFPNHKLIKLEQLEEAKQGTFNGTPNWQATAKRTNSTEKPAEQGHSLVENFTHVIFCSANQTDIISHFIDLPVKAIRGQVSSIELNQPLSLDRVLCGNGYVSPPLPILHGKQDQQKQEIEKQKFELHFGSTYRLRDNNQSVTDEDHYENLAKLTELLPNENWSNYKNAYQGRVSFRCTVTDYAPIIGPVPSKQHFVENYKRLNKNAKWTTDKITPNIHNLYINIGHGSRGLISTPLAGEYLANLICNETSVYERAVEKAIHPARFLIKQLKRGEL